MSTVVLAQAGQGSSNFLIPNATIIAEVIIFVVVFGIIWRYVVPPVKRSMNERQEMVRRQVEESEQARRRLDEADAKYRDALAEARTEAGKIRDEARADGQRIREELRNQAEQEVAQIRRRGEDQLANQRDQAVRELRPQIGTLAVTLAERVVGNSLEDESRRRETIDRFVSQIGDGSVREHVMSADEGTD